MYNWMHAHRLYSSLLRPNTPSICADLVSKKSRLLIMIHSIPSPLLVRKLGISYNSVT